MYCSIYHPYIPLPSPKTYKFFLSLTDQLGTTDREAFLLIAETDGILAPALRKTYDVSPPSFAHGLFLW